MCSIVMQTDYEKLVAAHTPPIFSHSPPTSANFLARYEPAPFVVARYKPIKVCSTSSPKRPCLVIRQSDDSSSSGDEDPTSPTRLKKRVVFADDRGMSLTHVRFMTEPSHVPPQVDPVNRYSAKRLAAVITPPPPTIAPTSEPWEITFSQPASDYVRFRKAVDMNKVSLENVIVRESDSYVMGTVKVSNIAFEKEVVVRSSSDNWSSHEDVLCRFVTNFSGSSIYAIYDTFSFNLPLPKASRSLEFCICYRCGGQEFWDNNGNVNYKLRRASPPAPKEDSKTKSSKMVTTLQPSDICNTKVDSWSEFASWTHLDTSNPYW